MPLYYPNSKLVAATFLRDLYGDPMVIDDFGVGGTLPADQTTWKNGFVQVSVVGGSPDIDVPVRKPIIQVDCWVPSINTSKPQWGRANSVAEELVNHFYENGENLQVPVYNTNYRTARIQSVYVTSEPREVTNDPAGHARVTFDMVLIWTVS